jgi:hypothetical protein
MDNKLKTYLVIGIGVAAMCYAFVLWLRLRRCASWPSVDGTVIRSEKIIARHNFQKVEKVVVRYAYFAGCRYESETVKVGGFIHMRKRDQDALLLKYPLGKTVQVYYDGNCQQIACLERSGMDSIFAIGGYGCFAFAIGLVLLFFA